MVCFGKRALIDLDLFLIGGLFLSIGEEVGDELKSLSLLANGVEGEPLLL